MQSQESGSTFASSQFAGIQFRSLHLAGTATVTEFLHEPNPEAAFNLLLTRAGEMLQEATSGGRDSELQRDGVKLVHDALLLAEGRLPDRPELQAEAVLLVAHHFFYQLETAEAVGYFERYLDLLGFPEHPELEWQAVVDELVECYELEARQRDAIQLLEKEGLFLETDGPGSIRELRCLLKLSELYGDLDCGPPCQDRFNRALTVAATIGELPTYERNTLGLAKISHALLALDHAESDSTAEVGAVVEAFSEVEAQLSSYSADQQGRYLRYRALFAACSEDLSKALEPFNVALSHIPRSSVEYLRVLESYAWLLAILADRSISSAESNAAEHLPSTAEEALAMRRRLI